MPDDLRAIGQAVCRRVVGPEGIGRDRSVGPGIVGIALQGRRGGFGCGYRRQENGIGGGGADAAFESQVAENIIAAFRQRWERDFKGVALLANGMQMGEGIPSACAHEEKMH